MQKIPYELIAIEADRLVIKAVIALDSETSNYWWQQYTEFLDTCGWSTIEFDEEMLKRIDRVWEQIHREAFPIPNWN